MANLGLDQSTQGVCRGSETIATAVGDRYVSDVLEERGFSLGGEQSGHIIFHEHLPTGDGLLTAVQVLCMLRRRRKPLSWMHGLIERYPQVALVNVHVKAEKTVGRLPRGPAGEIQKAREELGDQGRVVVRYSGTEPLLRIMMEGPDEARLKTLAETIAGLRVRGKH